MSWLAAADAECKAGIDSAYNGAWGYLPLVISLVNTKQVLRLLAWNDWQPVFFRLADALTPLRRVNYPLRC